MDFFKKTKKFRVRVAALIENAQGKYLLVKQMKKSKEYWLLPGGGIEFGESAGEALARELKEELDLEIKDSHFLLLNETIDPDGKRHLLQVVFSVSLGEEIVVNLKEKVLKDFGFFSAAEILTMEIRPDIKVFFKDLLTKNKTAGESEIHFITSDWVEG
ncbi:MAG: NUDIX hydrolase [Spirochaetota bacterium]